MKPWSSCTIRLALVGEIPLLAARLENRTSVPSITGIVIGLGSTMAFGTFVAAWPSGRMKKNKDGLRSAREDMQLVTRALQNVDSGKADAPSGHRLRSVAESDTSPPQ